MSRLAIKSFLAQQFALLDTPFPATVFIQRPKIVPLGEGAVMVLEMPSTREQRLTTPRGVGSKRLDHVLQITCYWLSPNADDGNSFDVFLDNVDAILRGITIPTMLTDPKTAAASQLVLIGEQIETQVNDPMEDDTPKSAIEGMVIFSAVKRAAIWEQVQG